MQENIIKINEELAPPADEAYRILRANIQFKSMKKEIKSVSVTSCNPGEGKTTTAINLAISMAKYDKKVLYVDADLRKPMKSKLLKYTNAMGLTNLLMTGMYLKEVVFPTNIKNLYYLPGGPKPPNPTELIGSTNFSEFLTEAENAYDLVIFDTPPLGMLIDAAIISAQTDGTLIVIESNVTDYRDLLEVKDQLDKANAYLLGVVVNKIRNTDYKNYYNYYSDFSENKNEKKSLLKKLKLLLSCLKCRRSKNEFYS